MLQRILNLFRHKTTEVKPLCLCCFPDLHQEVLGSCKFCGRTWPCIYVMEAGFHA